MYNILKENNKNAFLVGNIGEPILEQVDNITEDAFVVIEVSSHSLEFVKCAPHIAILLNIYPEHLDHVKSLEEYIQAKFNIAKAQSSNDYFIYNAENEFINRHDFKYKENDIAVITNDDGNFLNIKNKVYLKDNRIYFNNKFLMEANRPRKLKGAHTLNNMMFLLAVSDILELNLESTVKAICQTEGLEHRMEYVGKFNDIEFYDDAIATIPEATINCIKTLENVDTLICGGMNRGVEQKKLIEFLAKSRS